MKRIKINLMSKLLACSIIVTLVLGGMVYVSNKQLVALNNSLENLDSQHDNLKDIEELNKEEIKSLVFGMMEHTRGVKEMTEDIKDVLFKGIVVMGITALLLGIIVTMLTTVPIKKLINGARKIANGNLNTTIEVNTRDEIEELADIFNQMTARLRALIGRINQESEQVNAASQQLSAVSQEVSVVTERQADSTEENLLLLQEFNDLVEDTVQKVDYSTELTTVTNKLAIEGAKNNNDLINDMKKIDITTQKLNQTIKELNNKSHQISDVVETIDDIAEQTNILALNAAIEAARSNKTGQGFAVVAEEIRELAANVKKSTIEIRELIEGFQLEAELAVTNSNDNYKLIKKGIESTLDTVKGFEEIKENVSQLASEMLEIKEVTKEEEEKLETVVSNTEVINEIVKDVSSSAKETAISAEELTSFSENLEESVQEFDL
ncbi:methyl-accepting chemotaxis protein [Natroniella sulfidigena]|uniref:methyl-accepting chemotaxis protein n=1 Tax=Natroniella sulfidigena TaxID=723921 RepID=UPI00200A84EC|nr:methyl-accepting chemotaxis protein [Natroniella sulfidigena]MCK8817569.1 methyl-accepting chemotaxis protein [Natroniella sulfidigena]